MHVREIAAGERGAGWETQLKVSLPQCRHCGFAGITSRLMCIWFYEKPRAICPEVKWVDPAQPQMIFWLEISSCREGEKPPFSNFKGSQGFGVVKEEEHWTPGFCCRSTTNELCDRRPASSPHCASVSSPLKWMVGGGGTDDVSKPFQLKHSMILHRTVYKICGAQCKMKMQGLLLKLIKNFKTATA